MSKNDAFKRNVSIFDARVRAIDNEGFVKELVFADFSGGKVLGDAIIFDGLAFTDNGKFFDLKAGDGIFTAVEKTVYNGVITTESLTRRQVLSVLEAPIVDPSFQQMSQLTDFTLQYTDRQVASGPNARVKGPVATLECDVEFGTKGCRAQQWGWCDSCCITISNCKAKIGWEK